MIFKKLYLFIFLASAFRLFSQNSNDYNLLWKIEGNGLKKPSYLFGTMHVRDARAFNFSDSVMISLDRCSAFAMEIHPDTMMMDVFTGIMNSDTGKANSQLKDLLSKADYEKLDQKFTSEYGYSIEKLKIKNPFVIKSMLNRSKTTSTDKTTFVDAYLLGISKTLGKKIYGLEKTRDQLDFFNSLSKEELNDEFKDILYPEAENTKLSLNKFIEIYARGNIYEVEKEFSVVKLLDSVMVARNAVMVRSMTAIMRNTTLFTAVGVAHLPGTKGVIQLLRDKGYTVSPVAATFTGLSKNYSINPLKIKWERYADSLNGFSIESPGAFMDLKMVANLDTKFYFDLTNMLSYGYYAINMSNSEVELNEKKMIDNICKTYRSSEKYSLKKVKHLNKDGIAIQELIVKTSDRNILRLRLFIKNSILYGLFVGGEASKIYNPEAEKYFNSFLVTGVKIKKDPKWILFNHPKGAFSLALPFEPKVIVKEVPASDDTQVTYTLSMFMASNLGSMTNYLIRYNDYPGQMYIDKKEKVFNATIEALGQANKIASGADTIWKDGYEGRKFACFIQDKYYTEARIYIRGNRTYFLLKQNLVENSTKMVNDDFFNSFTFEPYKKTEHYTLSPAKGNFELVLPAEPKIVRDTVNSNESSLQNTVDYYSTNPNSGGLYQLEYSDLGEFFKVKNLTSYYATFMKGALGYADSLVSSDSITIDGFYGREYVINKSQEDNPKRARIWLADNKLFYMASYVGKDELFNEESNFIFNSFKSKKPASSVDIYGTKTVKILTGLLSKDTSDYKKALGAFKYYDFEKDDLGKLIRALSIDYKDDTLHTGAKASIIEAIGTLKDTAAYSALTREFYSKKNPDLIKSKALVAIPEIDLVKGLPVYLKLMLSAPALKTNVRSWELFSPLRDSLELTREKFDQVIRLLDSVDYRETILQIGKSICSSDSTNSFIKKYFRPLTKYAFTDLEAYLKSKEDTLDYHYHSEIYDYLELLKLSGEKEVSDKYTARLLSHPKGDDYFKATACAVRIRYRLPIDKKLLDQQLNDMKNRYEILQAYEEIGELNKINSKYTANDELGKLFLYNYVAEDGDYPEKVKLLGQFENENLLYYAYTFSYEGGEDVYLGISGPFDKKKRTALRDLFGYTAFEIKEKDWKEQAMKLLRDY